MPTITTPMRSIKQTLHALKHQRLVRRAWAELEAEAARQGCSPADIFLDRARRRGPGSPRSSADADLKPSAQHAPDRTTPKQRAPRYDIRGRTT
jgi:hypothetical protein